MNKAPDADILPFGENGWIATFAKTDDAVALALFANAVADNLRSNEDIIDAVAGIDSVSLRFIPGKSDAAAIRSELEESIGQTPFEGAPAPAKLILEVDPNISARPGLPASLQAFRRFLTGTASSVKW